MRSFSEVKARLQRGQTPGCSFLPVEKRDVFAPQPQSPTRRVPCLGQASTAWRHQSKGSCASVYPLCSETQMGHHLRRGDIVEANGRT